MNTEEKLVSKAEELTALGHTYGLEPKITHQTPYGIVLRYNNNLYSVISFTDTGKVSVKSYDKPYRKTESVSFKNLPDYLEFYRRVVA